MDLSLTSNLSISTYIGSGFGNIMQGGWALTYQRETESTRNLWQHMQETTLKILLSSSSANIQQTRSWTQHLLFSV